MNVLSLFDGMSCGQIALERTGIQVDDYYASEIDRYAIKVTQANYPNTNQIGSVIDVKADDLPKIDLLIGGSPCQGFSFAGKQLNFQDERSKLFFEYVRLLKEVREINPDVYFMLENVKMKKEYEQIITNILGCRPLRINSSLVSAQTRQRLYWTNIPVNSIPKDKGIMLKDIIENGEVDRDKSYCIDANYFKGGSLQNYYDKSRRQIVMHQSEKRLMVYGAAQIGRENGQQNELNNTEKSNALTSVQKDSLVKIVGNVYDGGGQNGNVYSVEGKSKTLSAGQGIKGNGIGSSNAPKILDNFTIRKLTPIECERLQTVPDNYTNHVSNTQRYKMLGNGWTVDIIAHILKHIK